MDRVYIVGGRQKPDARRLAEWQRFECAVIAELTPSTGAIRTCVEYTTPADAAPPEGASPVFKAATLDGDRLWVPTQTEVLCYRVPDFRQLARISLPCFNDVHHVRPTRAGTLLVADTGLDLVVELSPDGELLRAWDAGGDEPWTRFSRERDYRRVLTTKPHREHPNYVFELDDDIWTTRFEQRDAVCLTGPGRIAIDRERPHDGVLLDGRLHFTTVDGHVVTVDAARREVLRSVDVGALDGDGVAGWCRGIDPLAGDRALVGFSRIRPTRFARNLAWLESRLRGPEHAARPSHVGLFDLAAGRCDWSHDVQDAGIDAVFSVHAAPETSVR